MVRRLFDYLLTGGFFFIIALLAAHFTDVAKERVRGPFKALDGDSLLAGGVKLRLEGIDAPEWGQTCQRLENGKNVDWNCGKKSRDYLRSLVSKGSMNCNAYGYDKYDRPLVKCTQNNIDLNAQIVANGWAVSYGDYYAEEAQAKREKLGIWQGRFERPQEWRRAHQGELVDAGFGVNWLVQFKRWIVAKIPQ